MPNSEEEKNASSAIEDNAAGAEKPADAQAETGAAPQAEAELAASETEVGAAADEEETEADPLDDLNAKLEEAMAQLEGYRDQALRAEAEMQNVRRRAERDVANAHKFGLEKFLGNLVPVVDSLEKAIEAREGWAVFYGTFPSLKKYQQEPRFRELYKKIDHPLYVD